MAWSVCLAGGVGVADYYSLMQTDSTANMSVQAGRITCPHHPPPPHQQAEQGPSSASQPELLPPPLLGPPTSGCS